MYHQIKLDLFQHCCALFSPYKRKRHVSYLKVFFYITHSFCPKSLRGGQEVVVTRDHSLFRNHHIWVETVFPLAVLVKFKDGQNHTRRGWMG